jgi:hypothetical protein
METAWHKMEGHKRNEDIGERLERTPEHCSININRRTEDASDVKKMEQFWFLWLEQTNSLICDGDNNDNCWPR